MRLSRIVLSVGLLAVILSVANCNGNRNPGTGGVADTAALKDTATDTLP